MIYGFVATSHEFCHVDFSHVRRQGNCPTHLLAKHALGINDFQWRSQEVLFGGATININHISQQQKTQEEQNSYHYHYI